MRDQLAAIIFATGDGRPSIMSWKMEWRGKQYGMYTKMSVNPSQSEIDKGIDMMLEEMVRVRAKLSAERIDA
jgi:hypothetical protein